MKDTGQIFEHGSLPEAKFYNGKPFPLLVTPPTSSPELWTSSEAVIDYLKQNREHIMNLLRSHAVLHFRDFAAQVSTPETFAKIVEESLGLPNFPYELGNAVRTAIVGDRVFTANESPPEKPIPFHHELAQTPKYPAKLLFYCDRPADTGGETPVLLSRAVYDDLRKEHPEFLQKLEQHGVKYSRVMTPHDRPHSAIGRGWRATFRVQTRQEAEDVLSTRGYGFEWLEEGEESPLRETSPTLQAVVEAENGKCFFNQIAAVWGGWRDEFNKPEDCVMAGDGSALDPNSLDSLVGIMNRHRVAVPWKRGDFTFIDNMQAQHSRATFTGRRRVLASLVAAQSS
ncbi:Taurine catabolism dioxygenase TauD TfdA [Gracilaria domingensis]|nr:Taurine catabolism dioxygenase TauD TfdA [Gracilaria domingensis]